MKKIILSSILSAAVLLSGSAMAAECSKDFYAPKWDAQPPNVDAFNFVRAETDLQMKGYGAKGC